MNPPADSKKPIESPPVPPVSSGTPPSTPKTKEPEVTLPATINIPHRPQMPPLPPTSDATEDAPPHFGSIITGRAIAFLFGLLAITIVSTILGLVLGSYLSFKTGYFSELSNMLSLMLGIGPATLLFGLFALGTKKKYALYPLAAIAIASLIGSMDIIEQLRGLLPLEPMPIGGSGDRITLAVTTWLSYVMVYLVDASICAIKRMKTKKLAESVDGLTEILLILLLVIPTLVLVPKLHVSNARATDGVRMPTTQDFFALPSYGPVDSRGYSHGLSIVYAEPTKQTDGTYQAGDYITNRVLDSWSDKSTRTNCGGDNYKISTHPGQIGKNKYFKTTNGHEYAQSEFLEYSSNLAKPGNEYKVHYYCFVIDNRTYTLVRSERSGTEHHKKYSAADVIAAMFDAPSYYPDCYQPSTNPKKPTDTSNCKPSDVSNLENLRKDSLSKIKISRKDVVKD